jgi:hypothetical protein
MSRPECQRFCFGSHDRQQGSCRAGPWKVTKHRGKQDRARTGPVGKPETPDRPEDACSLTSPFPTRSRAADDKQGGDSGFVPCIGRHGPRGAKPTLLRAVSFQGRGRLCKGPRKSAPGGLRRG